MERAAQTGISKTAKRRRAGGDGLADWLKPALVGLAAFAVVGLLAWAVDYAVNAYHDRVALAGRSDDPTPVRLVIAGEPLAVPANMIRFPAERANGAVERVDLLLHWPTLEGYDEKHADAFRDGSTLAPLIYVTIAPRDTSLDSDKRLASVYSRFFTGAPIGGPSGLTGRRMTEDSGYRGEEIFYAADGPVRYAARCIAEATPDVPATCIRDVNFGAGLSMLYRFNRFYLGDWRTMDAELKALAATLLTPR